MLSKEEIRLITTAKEIIKKNFDSNNWCHTVGCALKTKSGNVYSAVNVDADLKSVCAEYIAVGMAISNGEREFDTIVAVYGEHEQEIIPPCKFCKDMLKEYAPKIKVIISDNNILALEVLEEESLNEC